VEFLTAFVLTVPPGTPDQAVEQAGAREAERARELAGQGHLVRLWRMPGEGQALGLWRARDAAEMRSIVESLPLYDWMTVQTTLLTPHPDDPAIADG
jgi:muconolactone delta-isomerase